MGTESARPPHRGVQHSGGRDHHAQNVILFVSPWAFGFTAVTSLAWSAWIVAIQVV